MQTLDYRFRRTSLNRAQLHFEPDGSFRVAIACRDPGLPNWLDTKATASASCLAHLLPEVEPGPIACAVEEIA